MVLGGEVPVYRRADREQVAGFESSFALNPVDCMPIT